MSEPRPAPARRRTLDLDTWAHRTQPTVHRVVWAAWRRLTEDLAPEAVLGIGAYSNATATSVVATVLTADHFAACREVGLQHPAFYRWSPAQWDRTSADLAERDGTDPFADLTVHLRKTYRRVVAGDSGETVEDYRLLLWELVRTTMSDIDEEDFLERWPNAVRMFDVPDEPLDPTRLGIWALELNPAEIAEPYIRYLTKRHNW